MDTNTLNEMIQECELMINTLTKRLGMLMQLRQTAVTSDIPVENVPTNISVQQQMETQRQEIMAELQQRHSEAGTQISGSWASQMPAGLQNLMQNKNILEMLKKNEEKK